MKSIINLAAIALFIVAIAFTPNSALADTPDSTQVNSARQAAEEAVQETGAKEQFGKTKSGDRLIDDAKEEANNKLNNLAEEANSNKDLPDSKKLFLKNLNGE
jgi:hypothetical protein